MVGEMIMLNVGLNDQVSFGHMTASHRAATVHRSFLKVYLCCAGVGYQLRGQGGVLPTGRDVQ